MMVSLAASEEHTNRLREIANSFLQEQWSVAIRLLNSHTEISSSPILLCNRALCYIKMELYKHAVKDCDEALSLNSCTLQAYLYKGEAMVALGNKEVGCQMWQAGYEAGLGQPSDLQMMLRLHSLATKSTLPISEKRPSKSGQSFVSMKADHQMTHTSKLNSEDRYAGRSQNEASLLSESERPAAALKMDMNLARGIAETSKRWLSQVCDNGTCQDLSSFDGQGGESERGKAERMVNAGNYGGAIRILTQLIAKSPASAGALIGRGTAYAFERKLDAAIDDFTKAIEIDLTAVEAWKRRGQARAATGLMSEALADLSKAKELEPKASDVLYERGVVYYKMKDYESAIEDLRNGLDLDCTNKYAHNYHGLALASIGDHVEAMTAYRKAVELDPSFKEAWTHMAKLHKELGNSEKALSILQKLLSTDKKYIHAYRLKGLLLYGIGDHRGAATELTIGLEVEPHNPDFHYLRGSCYHAIGDYADAVKDYDQVLDEDVTSAEGRTLQSLAFYQRETALYTASKRSEPFKDFNIDGDLDPMFKEAWCKRLSPMVILSSSKFRELSKTLSDNGHLAPGDFASTKARKTLLEVADELGCRIQYNCPGFLKNSRQHRMAGLAVLEIAQTVVTRLGGFRAGNVDVVNRKGTGDSSAVEKLNQRIPLSPSSTREANVGHSQKLTWRELYSIAVKWRQASEPCDPVVWVDMLSEKEFAAGFGSHTPLLLGQAKVVRYYPNFPRALTVAKNLILAQGQVFSAANKPLAISDPLQLQAVDAAANCSDIHNVVGQDFWLVTPCHSIATPGKILDGTRFTLQKIGEKGYDFSIRTPCTPPRWADYNEELTAAWEDYCHLYCDGCGEIDNHQELKQLQDSILRLSFYWYNFMPLARGTAVVGYILLLGLFLAADMKITASIPKGVQVDWEAILSRDLKMYIGAVWPWLYPSIKLDTSWRDLPKVSETFDTVGSAIGALSSHY